MIYDDAVDQVKGLTKTTESILKLAEVTSVRADGRAMVKFYGDALESSKVYPYIAGYKPTVGDIVLLMGQATTYIIIGKLSKEQIGDAYYMTKALADSTYLTENTADGRYMPISGTDKLVSGSNEVSLATKTLTPKTTNEYSLGSSTKKWKDANIGEVDAADVKATNLYGSWRYDASGSEIVKWEDKFTLRPDNNSTVYLGTSGKKFREIHGVTGLFTTLVGKWGASASGRNVYWNSSGYKILPSANDTIYLGESANSEFKEVWAQQFYQNGTAISTSDKRKKKNIKDITKDYVEFFKKLRPRLFKFKNGESGRLHMGFIAQEAETAADESGIELEDLAFICKDDEGNYGLRYDELIALQTKIIQELIKRVETLENKGREKK